MENAVKALEIAAGVLLGVIIMATVVYFFSSIGAFPQEQDQIKTAEQLAAFNLEYEVYDKKGMYGTDVISCLTKAQSNNEKYVEGGSFLTGNRYGDAYWINVYVKVKTCLKESVSVYHYNNSNKQVQVFEITNNRDEEYDNYNKLSNFGMKEVGFVFSDTTNGTYTNFESTTSLKDAVEKAEIELKGNKYIQPTDGPFGIDASDTYNAQLYNLNNKNEETPLQNLIKFTSSNMKQVVYNHTGRDLNVWSSATWQTALYDFKTRRFKCDKIQYSNETGRVNAICFSEI